MSMSRVERKEREKFEKKMEEFEKHEFEEQYCSLSWFESLCLLAFLIFLLIKGS